jgi:hypothetical protein
MPAYRLQFTAESCLTNATDIAVRHQGADVTFLFSKRKATDKYVRVQTEIDAPNNREAQARAATDLLPPVLDALSFTTGTPLLLIECELILKEETGNPVRRAIYVGHKNTPTRVPLRAEALAEASKLLQNEVMKLPTCWLRYALHRQLALDQFVFNWLAFEVLAGDADIPSRCPKCGKEIEHCGKVVAHRGSSKDRASELFHSANPETSTSEFKSKIWNTARNRVFHGRSYPGPAYLTELHSASTALRKAAGKQIAETVEIPEQKKYYRYDELFRVFLFAEWNTSDPGMRFAADWPEAELLRRTKTAELNRVFAEVLPENVTFLNYATQSPAW